MTVSQTLLATPRRGPLTLDDGDRIVVVGGGPAGSFFAIQLLRQAKRLGRQVELLVLESRVGLTLGGAPLPATLRSSCNYCAGGISPRMNDVLGDLGIVLPAGVVQSRIRTITIQSHWKNIELRVPEGREMYTVYRGSRPSAREDRHLNFDSFLLGRAADEGAKILAGEVTSLSTSATGRPRVEYLDKNGSRIESRTLEAGLLVVAAGVNQVPGMELARSWLARDLRCLIPGFTPPRIRRTMIFELALSEEQVSVMEGELYFILYGSRELRIHMGSLLPKGRYITVVLVGPDIDRMPGRRSTSDVVRAFLSLPHIRRILPCRPDEAVASCVCHPNMVVGTARNPFGDRVAVVGDMLTSRLYKDGIYSAYLTASSLAESVMEVGIDRESLRRSYGAVVRRLTRDQQFGRLVFATNTVAFRQPGLSRITYQAVLRERRTTLLPRRKLEDVLWRIASGDDSYRSILLSMFHPFTLFLIVTQGVFITVRNALTELCFSLRWKGLGRFPTGVSREDFDAKVIRLGEHLGIDFHQFAYFLRMYAIRIRAGASAVFAELGTLGDRKRRFLRPRFVDIRRVRGAANEVGSVVRYQVSPDVFSLSLVLERRDEDRYLVYRVQEGFAEGGVLVFEVEENGALGSTLSILVGFDIAGASGRQRDGWRPTLRSLFPRFVHDVLWNHSLCQLKDAIERRGAPERHPVGRGVGRRPGE